MSAMKIFVHKDQNQTGPFSEKEIEDMVSRGELAHNDLAWHNGLNDWQPIATIFKDFEKMPPPPPPAVKSLQKRRSVPTELLRGTNSEDRMGYRWLPWLVFLVFLLGGGLLIFNWSQQRAGKSISTGVRLANSENAKIESGPTENLESPSKIEDSLKSVAASLSGKIKEPLSQTWINQITDSFSVQRRCEYNGDFGYDIEKTDSIVSPYLGRIIFYGMYVGERGSIPIKFELLIPLQSGKWTFKDVILYIKGESGNWKIFDLGAEGHGHYARIFEDAFNSNTPP